jgi:hypothetical protein
MIGGDTEAVKSHAICKVGPICTHPQELSYLNTISRANPLVKKTWTRSGASAQTPKAGTNFSEIIWEPIG